MLAQEALDELRTLIFELRPPDLEKDGVGGALRKHVEMLRRQGSTRFDLEVDELPRDLSRDRDVLRIAQEALQNALRHAAATRVTIRLQRVEDRAVLEVADDGKGFHPAGHTLRTTRLGLTSMEERAARLGGALTIESAPDRGTTVRLEVPIGG